MQENYQRMHKLKQEVRMYHLQEGKVSVEYVVEVDLWVIPGVVEVWERLARVTPRHDVVVNGSAFAVDTVFEATAEQVDAHDTEDEPEDKADE